MIAERVCEAIERNENDIAEKILYLIQESKRIGREHGLLICVDNKDKINTTDYCIGGSISIKTSELCDLKCESHKFKVIGLFHTHPDSANKMSQADIVWCIQKKYIISVIGIYDDYKYKAFVYSYPYEVPRSAIKNFFNSIEEYSHVCKLFEFDRSEYNVIKLDSAMEKYIASLKELEMEVKITCMLDRVLVDCEIEV